MEFILVMALCILMAVGGRWLSRRFYQLAQASEKKQAEERFYRDTLLASVQSIDQSLRPEAPVEVDPVESLLEANRELMEKQKVQDAIEKELGVEM
jgi:hypothetical protein